MTFKQRLQADLAAERYKLINFANEAQLSPNYLYNIINGRILPSIHVATRLSVTANRLTNKTTYTPDMFMTIAQELHND